MVKSVPRYNFSWCYSTWRPYINSSNSRGKHKKAFSTFSNIESLIEMFPIMESRVLEAVKAAEWTQCSHAHQSTGWKEQPFTFTASRSTTGWSFNQSSTHFEICLSCRHLNGKAGASTAFVYTPLLSNDMPAISPFWDVSTASTFKTKRVGWGWWQRKNTVPRPITN